MLRDMLDASEEAEAGMPTNAEVVRDFLEALERLDFDAVLDMSAPGIVWVNAPFRTARGKPQLRRALRLMFNGITRFEAECKEIEQRADGVVFTDRIDTAEGGGLFMRLPVEGEFTVRDGLVTSWVDRFSWVEALSDIGKSLPRIAGHRLGQTLGWRLRRR